jgi:Flp pilus assembly protein TadG
VEFACVLPLIMAMLVGIWEVGRLAEAQQTLANAAREGARRAASGKPLASGTRLTDEVTDSVANTLRAAGYSVTNARVKIENLDTGQSATYKSDRTLAAGTDFDIGAAPQLQRVRVTVTVPYTDVRWAAVGRVTTITTLRADSEWYTIKDQDFPTFAEPPIE